MLDRAWQKCKLVVVALVRLGTLHGSVRMNLAEENPYAVFTRVAAEAGVDERVAFLRRTYLHLGAAVFAFAGLTAVFLKLPGVDNLVMRLFDAGRLGFLAILLGFMAAAWVGDRWASSATSPGLQYAGLSLYVVAEAVLFVPLLFIADRFYDNAIETAALITLLVFGGLTTVVLATQRDFSFLRNALWVGSFAAMAVIIASLLFGFDLGLLFVGAMIMLAAGYILYDTSNVLHHYRTDQHVSAALALFASVMLMFWYVLRLVMSLQRR
jgi:FtsH-binding integral membrane protein